MRFSQIRKMDISNGSGIGVSLFTQGCPYRCHGCHNSAIWSYDGGKEFTGEDLQKILKLIEPDWVSRFSILGGEPLIPENLFELDWLISSIREKKPTIKIWLWTGTLYEDLIRFERDELAHITDDKFVNLGWSKEEELYNMESILNGIDYLVDGRYVEEQRDITLKFRGSRNQRIIDMKKSMKKLKPILAEEFL